MEVAKGKGAGQGGSRPQDKSKDKEAKPLLETKGPEATPKAKNVAPKAKEANPKATNLLVSQPSSKEDHLPAKA